MKIKVTRNGNDRKLDFLDDIVVDSNVKQTTQQLTISSSYSAGSFTGSNNILTISQTPQQDKKENNSKLYSWISEKFNNIKTILLRKNAEKAFTLILSNKEQLENVKDKINKIRDMIEETKSNGQIALYEKLEKHFNVLCYEEVLMENGFNQFISEENLIKFVGEYNHVLSFTYLKNFLNPIPKNVMDNKIKAQKLNIFDNFVILHHDPELKNESDTKKEIADKKDPIMFGLIKGSRNMYFVGDWIDDYCDLTFDKMINKFSKNKLTINKDVKQRIKNLN